MRPSASGLLYAAGPDHSRVLTVEFGGRRVWSFREEDHRPPGVAPPERSDGAQWRFMPWPAVIRRQLTGTTTVGLAAEPLDEGSVAEAPVLSAPFSPDGGTGPLELTDVYGRRLVVNKWGRLGQSLVDAPEGMVDRMLDSMDRVREAVQGFLGDRVFVTGGTLLGPVREDGDLLPHDDDADLAYLSRASHPVHVALESMELGRRLTAAGFQVLRLSIGHVQVVVDHEGVPDHYVDVFTGFVLDGMWHQHFAIRTPASADVVLPPGSISVRGRDEPAPRDPERMLVELFGGGWRVPDPSYVFDIPPETGDRFYGWFADYNLEREDWDTEFLYRGSPADAARPPASAFAAWVDRVSDPQRAVLDLGCGGGADAWAWAAAGRAVEALDFSRHAVAAARRRRPGDGGPAPAVRLLNLLDLRAVLRLGAELAARPEGWTVTGRRLLNAVEDRGRDNVWRLCDMLLRPGGTAHFDLVEGAEAPGIPPWRRLTVDMVTAEAARRGLELVEATPAREPWRWYGDDEARVVTSWRTTFRRRP